MPGIRPRGSAHLPAVPGRPVRPGGTRPRHISCSSCSQASSQRAFAVDRPGNHCGGSRLHCGQFKFAAKRLVVRFRSRRRHQLLAHFLGRCKKARKYPQNHPLAGGTHFRAGPVLGLVDWRALELVGRFCHTASAHRRDDRHGGHRPGDAAENPGLHPVSDAGCHIRLYPVCPFAVRLPSGCLPLGGLRRDKHYFAGRAVPV